MGVVSRTTKKTHILTFDVKSFNQQKIHSPSPIHKERLRSTRWIILPRRIIFFDHHLNTLQKKWTIRLNTLQTTIELFAQQQ